jgi:pyridoxine kinase
MKTGLVPIADVITPNAYEAIWLTGLRIGNQAELRAAVAALHALGPHTVVISSTEWNHRISFFSWEGGAVQLAIETPDISRSFDGPGDVFTALLLANSVKFPGEYALIAQRTINSVFAVLARTEQMGSRELELPASLSDIVSPPDRFKVMTTEEFEKLEIIDHTILEMKRVENE